MGIQRWLTLVLLLTGCGALQLQEGAQDSEGSPFAGTCVANIEKSKRHPNHQFPSATMQFVVIGNTVTLTYGGVNAGGQQESGTVVLQADGKDHPVPEDPGVTVLTRWVGPRVLHSIVKSAGAQVGEQTYKVSADGKTLTAKVSGVDASGARFDQVIVFDRKEVGRRNIEPSHKRMKLTERGVLGGSCSIWSGFTESRSAAHPQWLDQIKEGVWARRQSDGANSLHTFRARQHCAAECSEDML